MDGARENFVLDKRITMCYYYDIIIWLFGRTFVKKHNFAIFASDFDLKMPSHIAAETCAGDILMPECRSDEPHLALLGVARLDLRMARCSAVMSYLFVGECITHRNFQEEIL